MNTIATPAGAPGRSNIDRLVIRFAGTLTLVSLVLSQVHSVYWLWVTAFVGANMLQASFTGFCPLAMILARLGVRSGSAFQAPVAPGA